MFRVTVTVSVMAVRSLRTASVCPRRTPTWFSSVMPAPSFSVRAMASRRVMQFEASLASVVNDGEAKGRAGSFIGEAVDVRTVSRAVPMFPAGIGMDRNRGVPIVATQRTGSRSHLPPSSHASPLHRRQVSQRTKCTCTFSDRLLRSGPFASATFNRSRNQLHRFKTAPLPRRQSIFHAAKRHRVMLGFSACASLRIVLKVCC